MLDFLINPVNTGIAAFTLLAVVAALGWFFSRRKVSIGKEGLVIDSEKQFIDKIPLFDRALQNILHSTLNDNKDILLAIIAESVPSKTGQMLTLFSVMTVLRYRIRDNHYSMILSSNDLKLKWIETVSEDMAHKLKYTEAYTGEPIGGTGIADCFKKVAVKQLQLYKSYVADNINNKLAFYRSLPPSKKTEALIEKNEKYLRGID